MVLAEVRERGGVGLSLRAVDRRMDMSPAGLYRYVHPREGLLTWLIADGFDDLADALQDADAAAGPAVEGRLRVPAAYDVPELAEPLAAMSDLGQELPTPVWVLLPPEGSDGCAGAGRAL